MKEIVVNINYIKLLRKQTKKGIEHLNFVQ